MNTVSVDQGGGDDMTCITVLKATYAPLSARVERILQLYRDAGYIVQITVVDAARVKRDGPPAIWIDDLVGVTGSAWVRAYERWERLFVEGTTTHSMQGVIVGECKAWFKEQVAAIPKHHVPPNRNERAWDTKRRKGR